MGQFAVTDYAVKSASRLNLNRKKVAVVGKHLADLAKTRNGRLDAEAVVADAKSPASPLHELFEWDDSAAARQYRLWQARHLLNSIQIRFVDSGGSSGEARAYAVVTEDDEQHYVPMVRVMRNAELRQQVLDDAERELAAFQRKYDGLRELFGVIRAIKKFRGRAKAKA